VTPVESVGRAILAAADKKAKNIAVLEVAAFLAITDHFLICSAPSDRQVQTIADEIERKLREEGVRPLRGEGKAENGWILIDYGDFVVHVFTDEMRAYYDLERLWKDAPRPNLPELAEAREALG
jgi:ribosome-associated protein